MLPKGFRAEFDLLHKAKQPFRRETQWLPDTLDDLIHLSTVVFRDLLFLLLWTTASESFFSLTFRDADLSGQVNVFLDEKIFLFFLFGFLDKFTCCASSASFAAYSSAILLNAGNKGNPLFLQFKRLY